MADSPNTRTLPEIHSRRAALVGIAGTLALATGAVGAVAVESAMAQDNPDAELIALCDRYIREWEEYDVCLGREMDAEGVARDNEPACPPELYETLHFADGPKDPLHAPRCNERPYWGRETLENYAKPNSTSWRNDVTHADGEMTLRMLTFPVPETTRARCRELLPIYDRWQAEIEGSEADWRALEELSSEQSDCCSETLDKIIEHEPQTLAGITALAKLALGGGMLVGGSSEEYTAVKRTIFEGLVRLNGGSVS